MTLLAATSLYLYLLLRNYRLVLEKDFRVLQSSLSKKITKDKDGNEHPTPMAGQDFQYLLRMRAHYTPQQLQAIESLFGRGDTGETQTNWTDFVLTMSRTKEEVKVETRRRQESHLGTIKGEFSEVTDA